MQILVLINFDCSVSQNIQVYNFFWSVILAVANKLCKYIMANQIELH